MESEAILILCQEHVYGVRGSNRDMRTISDRGIHTPLDEIHPLELCYMT